MECSECGTKVHSDDYFCPECGEKLKEGKKQVTTSGFAIASLIFGILFFIPFAPFLAILFGIIALVKIRSNKNFSGTGMAIAGIIIGSLVMFLIFLLIKNAPTIAKILGPIIIALMKMKL